MAAHRINVLVVDDERLARTGLRAMLEDDPELSVTDCADARTAVQLIAQTSVDIVFLDVQLRKGSGFDVIESIGVEEMPVVVFTTAYDSYAIRAFESFALDYLLKPIGDARLARAVDRAKDAVRQRRIGHASQQLAALLAHSSGFKSSVVRADPHHERIPVRAGNRNYFISLADVEWIEAADNYSRLWTGGKSHLVRIALNHFEEQLTRRGFVRTHRTALVRASLVREVRSVGLRRYVVVLSTGARAPVSRDRRQTVLQILKDARPPARNTSRE